MSWEYLAGFFDGEGTVYLPSTGTAIGPRLSIAQSGTEGLAVLTEIGQFFAEQGIKSAIARRKHHKPRLVEGSRPVWMLSMAKRADVEIVMSRLLPFLRIKKVATQDILRFLKLTPPLNQGSASRLIKAEAGLKIRIDPAIKLANQRARAKRFYENNKASYSAYQKAWRAKKRLNSATRQP
jgi:hypothetical protein